MLLQWRPIVLPPSLAPHWVKWVTINIIVSDGQIGKWLINIAAVWRDPALYCTVLHCTVLYCMAGSCTVQQRADQMVLTPHTDQGDTHQPSYYTDICEIWYNEIDNHITQLRYFITRYFTVDVSKLYVFFTRFVDITLKKSCYIKVLYLVTDLPTHSQIAIWRLDQSPLAPVTGWCTKYCMSYCCKNSGPR